MEIHNHGKNLKVHFPVKPTAENSAGAVSSESDVAKSSEGKSRTLIEQLESGSAVRQRLLVEIQAKVHAGEYQTRIAAEKAAENIVGY